MLETFRRTEINSEYSRLRLPLKGSLDLTYRCNNRCRHCWLWLPPDAPEKNDELSFDEIRRIAGEARAMGCHEWAISGGEPMLRPDFAEIFEFLTSKAVTYSLNTNGTLITPAIARLLKRKGNKMVAFYGATAEVNDAITRSPGSFEATMRGISYLREAGAGFSVQLIPMRDNYHQWNQMLELAQSLSPHYRCGAPWLYFSACGSLERNAEINRQRLDPKDVIELDQPLPRIQQEGEEETQKEASARSEIAEGDDRLFARCIASRRDFHIDPYGAISWCSFIKDRALCFDLRQGSFRQAWDEFIPSCAEVVRGGDEWRAHCGACEKRSDCRWCAAYAYLETSRYAAPIPYLCAVAKEGRTFKEEWKATHRRYFQIAGITVCVEGDLDFREVKVKEELERFQVGGPGSDNMVLTHHFQLPDLLGKNLGPELYRKPPWAISRKNGTWFYQGISPRANDPSLHRVAVFSRDHTRGTIYSPPRDLERLKSDGLGSLSLMPTDQIWLAPLLADRQAVLIHAAAAVLNGKGLVFVGHSEAGKSTTMEILRDRAGATILCDDRNVLRKWPDGWQVHGTWSHGTVADVSPASASLTAILFLHKSTNNQITPLLDKKRIWRRLLATLIKPMVTAEWWQKEMDVLALLVKEVPFYDMRFDKSGEIVNELVTLV